MEHSGTMTVKEAAALLGISPTAVRVGIENGALPFGVMIPMKQKRFVIYRHQFEQITGIKTEPN